MKIQPQYFGSVVVAVSAVLLSPSGQCAADSGAFDARAALHFGAPVFVNTYAFDAERVFSTQTQMIRRKATERQRQVAIANARAYEAAQIRALGGATPKAGKAGGSTAKAKSKIDPPSLQAIKAKLPRYVAVNTEMDERSVPGTKRDMMIWDTHAESLVDNNVYDVSDPPSMGATKKFDTYSTVYVGGKVSLPEIAAGPPPK